MDRPVLQQVTEALESDLERGRASCRLRAWADAYDSLGRADRSTTLSVEDVERLAWSAALTGRDSEFLNLLERNYQTCLDRDDRLAAARAAFWIGLRLSVLREVGRAGGWR